MKAKKWFASVLSTLGILSALLLVSLEAFAYIPSDHGCENYTEFSACWGDARCEVTLQETTNHCKQLCGDYGTGCCTYRKRWYSFEDAWPETCPCNFMPDVLVIDQATTYTGLECRKSTDPTGSASCGTERLNAPYDCR